MNLIKLYCIFIYLQYVCPLKCFTIITDIISSLQVLSRVVGRVTTPSCSGCWCRWSCGCSLSHVRLELRRSSTVLCQMKPSNTAGATSWTAGQLPCGRLPETPVWPRNCGRPVRGWWNWPDSRDVDVDSKNKWESEFMFICLIYSSPILVRETATTAFVWNACNISVNKIIKEGRKEERDFDGSPKYGIWCLGCSDRKYPYGINMTDTMKKSPERNTVQLDFEWVTL